MTYHAPPVDVPAGATIAERARILSDRRHTLYMRMQALAETGRPLNSDESATFDALARECETLDDEVMRLDGQLQRDRASHDSYRRLAEIGAITTGTDPRPDTTGLLPSMRDYKAGQERALSEGTGTSGGYLTNPQQSLNWFDKLRANSAALQAGPTILDATSDELDVPAIAASVTVAMTAENAQIAATDPAFAQLALVPKKLTAMTHVSNEIVADSNPSVRDLVAFDLAKAIGTKLDQQLLEGTGTAPQIRGLRNQSGILATSLATNGRAPTIDDVADAIGRMEGRNANCTAIIMSPRTWATYRKVADTTSRYQLSPDPSIDGTKSLFGVPVFTSSQISTSETSGTNSDCSWIGFVDTARWIVARRKEVELAYSPHFKFDYDQVSIRAIARFDAGLIDTASAELITGVRP